jgi:hypothetical protein
MLRRTIVLCVLAGLLAASLLIKPLAVSSAAAEPIFRVAGVQINSPVDLGREKSNDTAFFGVPPGTHIAVVVTLPTSGIVELDRKKSKVESFQDSTGKDIYQKPKFGSAYGMMSISKDKQKILFRVSTEKLPAKGAKSVSLKGSVVLKVGTATSKGVRKRVKLAVGTSFKAGPYSLEITTAEKSEFFDGKFQVQLESKQDFDAIVAVRFLDSKGAELKAESRGSGRMSFGKNTTWTRSYHLDKIVKRATIEIEYWKDMKTVELPYTVQVGVGL